MGEMVMLLMGL